MEKETLQEDGGRGENKLMAQQVQETIQGMRRRLGTTLAWCSCHAVYNLQKDSFGIGSK